MALGARDMKVARNVGIPGWALAFENWSKTVQGDSEAGPNAFSLADAEKIVGPDFDRLKKNLTHPGRYSVMNGTGSARHEGSTQCRNTRMGARLRELVSGPESKYRSSLCDRLRPILEGERPSWYSDIACYLVRIGEHTLPGPWPRQAGLWKQKH
jgi:hypothetical protein